MSVGLQSSFFSAPCSYHQTEMFRDKTGIRAQPYPSPTFSTLFSLASTSTATTPPPTMDGVAGVGSFPVNERDASPYLPNEVTPKSEAKGSAVEGQTKGSNFLELSPTLEFDENDELLLKSTEPSLDLSKATFRSESMLNKNMTVLCLDIGTFLIGREVATLLKRQTFNMYRSMKLRGIGILRAIPEHVEYFSHLGVVKIGTHSLTLIPYEDGRKFIKDCKLREARLEKRRKQSTANNDPCQINQTEPISVSNKNVQQDTKKVGLLELYLIAHELIGNE